MLICLHSNFFVKTKSKSIIKITLFVGVHSKNSRDLPPGKLWPGKEFPESSIAAFGTTAVPNIISIEQVQLWIVRLSQATKCVHVLPSRFTSRTVTMSLHSCLLKRWKGALPFRR